MPVFLSFAIAGMLLIVLGALLPHAWWWLIPLGIVVVIVDLLLTKPLLGDTRRRPIRR